MSKKKSDLTSLKAETRLIVAGREFAEHGIVNPAVYHASTITFPTVKTLLERDQPYTYGRKGTPTSRALETAIAALEGGHDCKVSSSGLAAVTTTLLAFLKAGEHVLIPDTVYHPVRQLCDSILKGLGIETTYYDPLIGRGIAGLIRANTKVVYCESPGSQTMEVQDIPVIADVAHGKNCIVILDNTWAGGFYFDAFAHGCDVSVQAATKYIVGHSDAMLGSTVCNEKTWEQFKQAFEVMGQFAGPDDMYLALRGLRTMSVRLERHMRNATAVAEWLRGRSEVESVMYPALSNDPGHQIWKRDFTGASGLFSVVLKPTSDQSVAAMLDGLSLFGMGFSWGGFESLVVPFKPVRTATTWTAPGPCLRLHIGLESPDDLIVDLKQGFERLKKSS
ncbi:MAG TPA: cystathionine beta-lyase [Aestuariivirga sp.]|jgi:cystathionine beta-lyase|nr:cystathionine beta-lyase [Hyphomicrobiales bacterium]MBP9174631.1 cystathionine beta-lyase [Hyphomicrobiales bacterium]HQY73390.1 cystathionine beta-lyase [Aestuariivirga sp.]